MELDYETNDVTLDEVRKLSSNLRYPNEHLTDQTFLQSLHFADEEARDTPELKELVLRGLNIRQVPTYLNRLGLDARDIDVRRISDNSVILIFDSGTSALSGIQTLAGREIQDATQQEPYEFLTAEPFSEVQVRFAGAQDRRFQDHERFWAPRQFAPRHRGRGGGYRGLRYPNRTGRQNDSREWFR